MHRLNMNPETNFPQVTRADYSTRVRIDYRDYYIQLKHNLCELGEMCDDNLNMKNFTL